MLRTTRELLEYLKPDKSTRDVTIINSLIYPVIKCGDKGDADAILMQYLTNPSDFNYSYLLLLPVFRKFGDNHYAQQIFNLAIQQNRLNENIYPEVLEILGALKYNPVKQILIDYAFGHITNYYLSKSAVLALLNFDCSEYQTVIEAEIEKCYGKNLFLEFVPALVCKLKNKKSILEKLYELGARHASTDCNAGIVLGFSLCGEEGKKYFKRILFDNNWETYCTSTGTVHYTYQGLTNFGITFRELFSEIKTISEHEKLKYYLTVFFSLLKKRIDDFETNYEERFADIYTLLFKVKNNNERDNLFDVALRADKMDKAYEIKNLIELKMNEEAILKNYIIR